MNAIVAITGLIVLTGLALYIGGTIDRWSRDSAWRAIAKQRAKNWRDAQAVRDACEHLTLCADCPFRRRE